MSTTKSSLRLIDAIQAGETAKALQEIERGAALDTYILQTTPLVAAIEYENQVVFDALLAAGANATAPIAPHEITPLHMAAAKGNLPMIEALLHRGADPNAVIDRPDHQFDGRTPLFDAVFASQLKAIELLLNRGADLFLTDGLEMTPLDASRFATKRTANFLRKHILANPQLKQKVSPHLAARNALTDLLHQRLDEGISPNARSAHGRTLLHDAVLSEHLPTVQLLLDRGADPNAADDRGVRPLALAGSDIAIVEALLSTGADPGADSGGSRVIDFHIQMRTRLPILERMLAAMPPASRPYVGALNPVVEQLRSHLKEMPALAEDPKFIAAVARLEEQFGRKATPWKRRKGAICFPAVSADKHDLHALALETREQGFTLFATDVADAGKTVPVVLMPTSAPAAAALASGTNGINEGLDANAVAAWLIQLHETDPFVTLGAGFDYFEGRFLTAPADPEAMAQRMIEFCPEYEEEEDLAAQLARNVNFFFWWD